MCVTRLRREQRTDFGGEMPTERPSAGSRLRRRPAPGAGTSGAAEGGQHDDANRPVLAGQFGRKLEAGHPRHLDVGQHDCPARSRACDSAWRPSAAGPRPRCPARADSDGQDLAGRRGGRRGGTPGCPSRSSSSAPGPASRGSRGGPATRRSTHGRDAGLREDDRWPVSPPPGPGCYRGTPHAGPATHAGNRA